MTMRSSRAERAARRETAAKVEEQGSRNAAIVAVQQAAVAYVLARIVDGRSLPQR
jgi:hypothetical protein